MGDLSKRVSDSLTDNIRLAEEVDQLTQSKHKQGTLIAELNTKLDAYQTISDDKALLATYEQANNELDTSKDELELQNKLIGNLNDLIARIKEDVALECVHLL